jgi:hypothetical protein
LQIQTPKPLLNELAPHETLELDELDELEAPELVEEEEVEVEAVEAVEDVEEVVEVTAGVELDEDVCWLGVTTGVSLQGLLGKAIYEGIADGIAGTWHFPFTKMNPTSQTHSFPL